MKVAGALLRMRQAALAGRVNFRELTDPDQGDLPRSVIDVSVAATETTAVVPFSLEETVTVNADGSETARAIADLLIECLNGRGFFDVSGGVVIHRHTLAEMGAAPGLMARTEYLLRWEGEASWGPS